MMKDITTSGTTVSAAFSAFAEAVERAARHPERVDEIVTLRRQSVAFHRIVAKLKVSPVLVGLVCHQYGLARDVRRSRR